MVNEVLISDMFGEAWSMKSKHLLSFAHMISIKGILHLVVQMSHHHHTTSFLYPKSPGNARTTNARYPYNNCWEHGQTGESGFVALKSCNSHLKIV